MEYNAGGISNTLRLAEKDITCGSDFYTGVVLSIGEFHQSADIVDFSTSTGSLRLKIANTPGSLKGQRFSDLFATLNFVNRSWRLYLWEESVSATYKTQIASGYITSDIECVDEYVFLTLVDYGAKWEKELPQTKITASAYPNAPENNIGKPIPIWYGDFDVDPDAPTSGCEFDRHYVKGQVPAVITDKFNATDNALNCYPDTVGVKQLRIKNVFLGSQGKYCPCEDANVNVASNPKIKFSGSVWRLCVPLLAHSTTGNYVTGYSYMIDQNHTSGANWSLSINLEDTFKFNIPKLPNLGKISTIDVMINCSGGAGTPYSYTINGINGHWGTDETLDITSTFSSADISNWTLNNNTITFYVKTSGTSTVGININEVALEIEFAPSESFFVKKTKRWIPNVSITPTGIIVGSGGRYVKDKDIYSLKDIEMVFVSGSGRMFGAWIDQDTNATPRNDQNGNADDPGYDEGALIENPIYIIEDICRRELGMDPTNVYADIDIESFDYAGGKTSSRGVYASLSNWEPKFAFSLYQIAQSKELIQQISEQCNTWFFFSGDGKIKAKTRNLAANYNYYDKVVDYNKINVTRIARTGLDSVFNDVTINYAMDYQSNNLLKQATSSDATSQGTGVNGVGQVLKYELDADLIRDNAIANKLAVSKINFYKYQKNIIEFETADMNYWNLEICDILKFTNWDSNRKVNGETPGSNDYYSIFDISKNPDTGMLIVKCFEVS